MSTFTNNNHISRQKFLERRSAKPSGDPCHGDLSPWSQGEKGVAAQAGPIRASLLDSRKRSASLLTEAVTFNPEPALQPGPASPQRVYSRGEATLTACPVALALAFLSLPLPPSLPLCLSDQPLDKHAHKQG